MHRRDEHGRARLVLWGIVALAAIVRLIGIRAQSLWFDEILTVQAASGTLADVVFHPRMNTRIPPFYYVIVHFFSRLSSQELWLRFPSVVAGVAGIPLFWGLVRRRVGIAAAHVAALLMALSPFHVWYSQEARPYSFLLFLSLLTLWCFERARERPTLGRLATAVVALAALIDSHTVSVTFLPFLALWVALRIPRRAWPRWAGILGAGVVLALPGLWLVTTYPPVPPAPPKVAAAATFLAAPYLAWVFATGFSIGPSVAELHAAEPVSVVVEHALPVVVAIVPLALVGASGLVLGIRRMGRHLWYPAAWFAIPAATAFAASLLPGETFNPRYAIVGFPGFVFLFALGVTLPRSRALRGAALAALCLVQAFALVSYRTDPRYHREDNRGAGAFLARHARASDTVLACAGYTRIALAHYAPGAPVDYLEADEAEVATLEGFFEEGRVWLFRSRAYHGNPEHRMERRLESVAVRSLEYRGDGVELVLYERLRLTEPSSEMPGRGSGAGSGARETAGPRG